MALKEWVSERLTYQDLNNNFNSGKVVAVYTGTDLNAGFSKNLAGIYEEINFREFTFGAEQLSNATYLDVSINGTFFAEQSFGSATASLTSFVTVKIETKPTGGSYTETLPEVYVVNPTAFDDDNRNSERVQFFNHLHTISEDEASDGIVVKLTIKVYGSDSSDTGGSWQASFGNRQIIIRNLP